MPGWRGTQSRSRPRMLGYGSVSGCGNGGVRFSPLPLSRERVSRSLSPAACPCRRTATAAPIAGRPAAGSASAPICGFPCARSRPSAAHRPAMPTSPCCTSTITSPAFSPRSAAGAVRRDIGDHHALLVRRPARICPSCPGVIGASFMPSPEISVGFCTGGLPALVARGDL